ncbi:hypothetical protein WG909_07470 [Peptostreptococcaceae bacterium AGR-M142]
MNTKNNFLSYIKKSIEFKALDFKKQYNKLKKSEYCTSNISISLENKNSYIDYIPCESYETDDNDIYDFFDSFFNRNQISQIKNLYLKLKIKIKML